MTTLVFAGITMKVWQEDEINYDIPIKKTDLMSGAKFGSFGAKISPFPMSFNCYTERYQKIIFTQGAVAFTAGATVTGGTSGATAKVKSATLTFGSWGGVDADGYIILYSVSGNFVNGETITDTNGGSATTASTPTIQNISSGTPNEITDIRDALLTYNTLVVDGVSYSNCYISSFGKIKELVSGHGVYKYFIEFDQVDCHS
jgi:hypothetical protein